MSSIFSDISTLEPWSVVEFWELDLPYIGTTRFHPGVNENGDPVIWRGNEYTPFPIAASGFERNSSGTLPRPIIRLSNYDGLIGALLHEYDDALGARVIRYRTLVKYIDAVNFKSGENPTADPEKMLPRDVWYVARRSNEDPEIVELELASPWDAMGTKLPRRQVLASTCNFYYRGPAECQYAGPMFDVNNLPTTDPAQDICNKTLQACRIRFGVGAILPYGGFPSSLLMRGG